MLYVLFYYFSINFITLFYNILEECVVYLANLLKLKSLKKINTSNPCMRINRLRVTRRRLSMIKNVSRSKDLIVRPISSTPRISNLTRTALS